MNHLRDSSSPYLLQHASNPVEWYPWGEAAFRRAREEHKPIFLSIGYSTCHWCHVMAHESFENEKTAKLLNEYFISIKVDREERPDVDRLYMSYVQNLTGSGGWPLSVWLTPELKPFFGGTYFPPENQYGRVGFPSVLLQLAELWKEDRWRLEKEAAQAMIALQQLVELDLTSVSKPIEKLLQHAYEKFSASFDGVWGGFGNAPKFPRPSVLFFLLRYADAHKNEEGRHAQEMVLLTLEKMAAGGLHDHLGGGFHRYSVDRLWQVPHFEKMLYDQAQLAMAYLEAWQMNKEKKYAAVVHDILNYVKRDMTATEGGFYSAEDADSFNESGVKSEGAFYVWSEQQIRTLLSEEEYKLFARHYHVRKAGNVPSDYDPHEELMGKNILMVMEKEALSKADEKSLMCAREKLFSVRKKRLRPHCDDKILTAWNGLMISAYARAGAALAREDYIEAATRAAAFLRQHLYDAFSGKLRRSWRAGRSTEFGFAEDYAFLIQGLLDLYEATSKKKWLQWAKDLQEKMNELFWDTAGSAYFSSAAGDSYLLLRMKEEYDGAEPSANSIAALNQLRFSRIFHDETAVEKAMQIFKASATTLEKMPTAVPQLLVALSEMRSDKGKKRVYRCDNFCCEKVME